MYNHDGRVPAKLMWFRKEESEKDASNREMILRTGISIEIFD